MVVNHLDFSYPGLGRCCGRRFVNPALSLLHIPTKHGNLWHMLNLCLLLAPCGLMTCYCVLMVLLQMAGPYLASLPS